MKRNLMVNDGTTPSKPKRICAKEYKAGYQVGKAISAVEKQRREFQNSLKSYDTFIRMQIHNLIRTWVGKGSTKQNILEMLNSMPEYLPFSEYFEEWIEGQQEKSKASAEKVAKIVIKQMLETGQEEETVLKRLYKQEINKENPNTYAIKWITDRQKKLEEEQR